MTSPIPPNQTAHGTSRKAITLRVNNAQPDSDAFTVVVLGVERGGTSMVAGVIRAMGINMGDFAGHNHEDPSFLTEDSDKLRENIRLRDLQNDVWGFKMPKATMKLDFFERELRNPVYVVAYRNPLAIADSWIQRKADNLMGVLNRIHQFNELLNAHFRTTRHPVLLVNYERAVRSPESQSEFIDTLAEFLRLSLTTQERARALGMMTGDGGGYTNLPEYRFSVEDAADGPMSELPIVERVERDAEGWIRQERVGPRHIVQMADGSRLPQRFRLRILFHHGTGTRSRRGTLRMFFRFTGDYRDAHCFNPLLREGVNVFDVETSGLADALAFGGMESPCMYKMTVQIGEAESPSRALVSPAPQRSRLRRWMARLGR